MADDIRVEVKGIRDLQNALGQVDKAAPREMAAGLAKAGDVVATDVRQLVPRRSGAAANSIGMKKIPKGATLVAGGSRVPYFGWLDFGGRVGRNNSVVRPFIKRGRYIYPTLDRKQDDVISSVDKEIADAAAKAGFTEQRV